MRVYKITEIKDDASFELQGIPVFYKSKGKYSIPELTFKDVEWEGNIDYGGGEFAHAVEDVTIDVESFLDYLIDFMDEKDLALYQDDIRDKGNWDDNLCIELIKRNVPKMDQELSEFLAEQLGYELERRNEED